jgi:hypothetical protein
MSRSFRQLQASCECRYCPGWGKADMMQNSLLAIDCRESEMALTQAVISPQKGCPSAGTKQQGILQVSILRAIRFPANTGVGLCHASNSRDALALDSRPPRRATADAVRVHPSANSVCAAGPAARSVRPKIGEAPATARLATCSRFLPLVPCLAPQSEDAGTEKPEHSSEQHAARHVCNHASERHANVVVVHRTSQKERENDRN